MTAPQPLAAEEPTAAAEVNADDLAWLDRVHLFHGLPEEVRRAFLLRARKVRVPPGGWLIEYADPNPPLVLLQRGRAEVFTREGERPRLLGLLEAQDHAGAEAIVMGRRSAISVRALRPTVAFRLEGGDVLRLARRFPAFAERLTLAAESQYRARVQRPVWLSRQEWVLVFVPRHWWVLIFRWFLVGSSALGLAFLLAFAAGATGFMLFAYLSALIALMGLAVAAWVWVEWRNDYYIVTTRRAARIDRLFPIYDSRHEVPITMINAAEVETGFWGRRLHFGTVIARTWAEPPLRFDWAPHPEAIGEVLDELVRRTQAERLHAEKTAIQRRLRERLGLPAPQEPEVEPTVEPVAEDEDRPQFWDVLGLLKAHLFHARLEHGGVITYRKHWIFLVARTFTPALLTLAVWIFFFWHRLRHYTWPAPETLWLLVVMTTLVAFLVLLYQAWDWANDIYQITDEQIRDIKAIPFGEVQRKIAPLEKVVSVDFERPSFWARVFNYGQVTVQTGPEEPLVFYRVAFPDQVQQDLFLRMEALRRRKAEEEWLRQQERFLDWLAAYHDLARKVFGPAAEAPPPEPEPLPPLPAEDEEVALPPGLTWEEALGFDYDPWVQPPGLHPDQVEDEDEAAGEDADDTSGLPPLKEKDEGA